MTISCCARFRRGAAGCLVLVLLAAEAPAAGGVQVDVRRGDLVVDGDGDANAVRLESVAGGIRVVGLEGTLVNGAAEVVVAGVDDDVRIDLGGGDDTVLLDGLDVPDDIRIRASFGDDHVEVLPGGLTAERLKLGGGPGDDTAVIRGVLSRDMHLKLDEGDDVVELVDLDVTRSIKVRTALGADTVSLDGVTAGRDVLLDVGRDADLVTLVAVTVGDDLIVRLNQGDDTLDATGLVVPGTTKLEGHRGNDALAVLDSDLTGKARLRSGPGEDGVELTDARGPDALLVVSTSRGDDVFQLSDLTFRKAKLRGGRGTDLLLDGGGNTFDKPLKLQGFEQGG